jgi:uncharacterized protein YbaA (DUF1428 family)
VKNVEAYRKLAQIGAKVWIDHGALEFRECVGDDLDVPGGLLSFKKLAGLKRGETVLFSWITYKSRAHRDRVNAKVMKDERILATMSKKMPFDMERMAMGGFQALVEGKRAKRRG